MKKSYNIYVILILLTMCLFSSCGNKNKDGERYDINTQNVGEFVDVAYAKEKLEPAIWGSQGYSIYYQKQSPYIYAAFGEYMLYR